MIKKLVALIFILTGLLVTCCGGSFEDSEPSSPSCNINTNDCQHNVISFTLLADDHLKDETKIAILDALAEWDIKTGDHIGYVVKFKDMSTESNDPAKFNDTYKLWIKDPGPGLLGWTSWISSNNSAIIYMKPSMDSNTFKIVLLHELGHAFDLHFDKDTHYTGPYKSVMHPAIGNTDKLECPELLAFCDKYKCQADCVYASADSRYLQSSTPSSQNVCETPGLD
jgi:hypothetical protein